ncbi:MAG: acyl-CoA-binding protein [Pseudomonadota bacterium]
MSDLQEQFAEAIKRVETAEGDQQPSNEVKLQMYALFKQGTQGDVSGKKPGAFDLVGKAKWAAWEKLEGMSQEDAMQQYIDNVNEMMS